MHVSSLSGYDLQKNLLVFLFLSNLSSVDERCSDDILQLKSIGNLSQRPRIQQTLWQTIHSPQYQLVLEPGERKY